MTIWWSAWTPRVQIHIKTCRSLSLRPARFCYIRSLNGWFSEEATDPKSQTITYPWKSKAIKKIVPERNCWWSKSLLKQCRLYGTKTIEQIVKMDLQGYSFKHPGSGGASCLSHVNQVPTGRSLCTTLKGWIPTEKTLPWRGDYLSNEENPGWLGYTRD